MVNFVVLLVQLAFQKHVRMGAGFGVPVMPTMQEVAHSGRDCAVVHIALYVT